MQDSDRQIGQQDIEEKTPPSAEQQADSGAGSGMSAEGQSPNGKGPAEEASGSREEESIRQQMNLPQMPTWGGCTQNPGEETEESGAYDAAALQELLQKDLAEILGEESIKEGLGGESGSSEAVPFPEDAAMKGQHPPDESRGERPRGTYRTPVADRHRTDSGGDRAAGPGSSREQRQRSKEAAAEERARRVRFEMHLIIGLLAAGILLCLVLTVILMVRPDFIFNRTQPVTEESTAEVIQEEEQDDIQADTGAQAQTQDEALTYVGLFELPLEGATGYAPSAISVTDENGSKVAALEAGEAYVILGSDGEDLLIETGDGIEGRVPKSCSWINLPDVIPSIIYYDSNSVSSLFSSSGYNLPGITGEALYNSLYMNERFGEEQFCMPVLYEMAVKIMKIQQACLANGESLKIYQTFRPYETQMAVAEALQELEDSNAEVYAGLNDGAWSDTWFIATKLSNHQRGCAIDVSLVQVDDTELRSCGEYQYIVVTEYTEYGMPSDMHELSYRAAVFDPPVSSSNDTAWRTATYADTMTLYAYRLLDYCTEYGLSPLSSEWWHFNDLEAKSDAGSSIGTGRFYLEECLSRVPSSAEE